MRFRGSFFVVTFLISTLLLLLAPSRLPAVPLPKNQNVPEELWALVDAGQAAVVYDPSGNVIAFESSNFKNLPVEAFAFLGRLERLESVSIRLLKDGDKFLEKIRGLPHLRKLAISCPGITPYDVTRKFGFFKLQHLTLQNGRDLGTLVPLLKLPELNYVSLPGANVRNQDLKVLSQMKRLTELRLDTCSFEDTFFEWLTSPTLKSLSLQFLYLKPLTARGLIQLSLLPELKSLDISDCNMDVEAFRALERFEKLDALNLSSFYLRKGAPPWEALKKLRSLKSLRLARCRKLEDVDLAFLADLSKLEALDLSQTPIEGQGLTSLKNLSHLRRLDLWGSKIMPGKLDVLADLNLQEINLNSTEADDSVLALLQKPKSLTALSLAATKITRKSLPYLQSLQKLEKLSLATLPIESLPPEFFDALPQLTTLNLQGMPIGDDTGVLFSRLKKLEWLELTGTKISNPTIKALKELPALRVLYLRGTKVGNECIKEFAFFPNLEVLGLSGDQATRAELVRTKVSRKVRPYEFK